jgi:hypothetical protein
MKFNLWIRLKKFWADMTLEKASYWATVLAALAAIVALYLTTKYSNDTLQNVLMDRQQNEKHHKEMLQLQHEVTNSQIAAQQSMQTEQLEFQQRPLVYFKFVSNQDAIVKSAEGGIEYADKKLDGKSKAPKLLNFGFGPAVDIKTQWICEKTIPQIPDDEAYKTYEKQYPVSVRPAHLAAGEIATCFTLPECFSSPLAEKITAWLGRIRITYRDSQGKEHSVEQKVNIILDIKAKEITLIFETIESLPDYGSGALG